MNDKPKDGCDEFAQVTLEETELTPLQDQKEQDELVKEKELRKNAEKLLQGRPTLIFPVDSTPPWYIVLLYAFQQVLSTIGGPVTAAFIITETVCGKDDPVFLAELIGTSTFMSGLCTFLQVTFGVRLPIIQGSTMVYVPVISSLMLTPQWRCPQNTTQQSANETFAFNDESWNSNSMASSQSSSNEALWKPRMMEVTGALAVAASFQVFLGCTGLVGVLMRFIGPLTVAPAVGLIGFSLQDVVARYSSAHWGVSISTAAVFILVSQFLKNVLVPFPSYSKSQGFHAVRYPVFRLFPPVFAILYGWTVCLIMTLTGGLTDQPGIVGYNARTDTKLDRIAENKWFFFPYPGMWGMPAFSPGVLVGMVVTTINSTIESIGDYYATARACQVPSPPKHAMNRGIAIEGFGSVICGLLGAAHATTSYSQTIGFVPLTGMGSRITWQVAGVLLMMAGIFGKFGAILSTIPEPVLGGIMIVSFGMVISVGLSNIQFVDMSTGRNMMILGCSLLLGLMVPAWIRENVASINTGSSQVDQMFTILLGNPMFVGGTLGCLLDNLLPGTLEERGMTAFHSYTSESDHKYKDNETNGEVKSNKTSKKTSDVYDLPFSKWISCESPWLTYFPFLPCYQERSLSISKMFSCLKRKRKIEKPTTETHT